MPPSLKKWGAYCFKLVRLFVCPFVRLSIRSKKIQARVLKFHIWIPRQKIAYPYLSGAILDLACPSAIPLFRNSVIPFPFHFRSIS